MIRNEDMDNGGFCSRPHKTWCFPLCCCACNTLLTPCRRLVSRSKRRFEEDGFNLDLTYVTPRIIVHGFPAIGVEHLYRNPRGEILRFLDTRHEGKYKLYNFCCEPGRGYDGGIYHDRVERYPFKDHNTPPLMTMHAFANSAKLQLDANPENVVSMHCKAGKGRAGLMCCVLLVRTGVVNGAIEAMALYDKTRVKNNKGLTVTSQRKYVIFYELLWRRYWGAQDKNIGDMPCEEDINKPTRYIMPEQPELPLYAIEVVGCKEGVLKNITISVYKGSNNDPLKLCSVKAPTADQTLLEIPDDKKCNIQGNFKVRVDHAPGLIGGVAKVCELWHNTLFIESGATSMLFPLDQLDVKRKQVPKYGTGLSLRLYFTKDRANATDSVQADLASAHHSIVKLSDISV